MQVRLFGRLSDSLGFNLEVAMTVPCSIAEVRSVVAALYPAAAAQLEHSSVRACVGDQIVAENFIVEPDQAVEFLSTVSGG